MESINNCCPSPGNMMSCWPWKITTRTAIGCWPEFAQKMDVFLEIVGAIDDRTHFGVQYDPSNAIVAGDDPIELLERVKDRRHHARQRPLSEPGATLDDLRQTDGTIGYFDKLKHGVTGKGSTTTTASLPSSSRSTTRAGSA